MIANRSMVGHHWASMSITAGEKETVFERVNSDRLVLYSVAFSPSVSLLTARCPLVR